MSLFSIIIPTYNRASMLSNAIHSVQNQSLSDWELIIVDNASTDGTREKVTQIDDHRIRYFHREVKGRSAARNFGIQQAAGKWICFLDSDDTYEPNHLEVLRKEISLHPETPIFKTGITFKNENREIIFQSRFLDHSIPQFKFVATRYCSILDLCINKELAFKHEFEPIETWEDKAYILDLLQHTNIHQIEKRTVIANEHSDRSIIKTHERPEEINAVFKVMRDKLNRHSTSKDFIKEVQQRFLYTVLFNARKTANGTAIKKKLLSELDIKPTLKTNLKLFLAGIFNL